MKDWFNNLTYCHVERIIKGLMTLMVLLFLLLIFGCSRHLLKQAPVLAVEERVFVFEETVGTISHNRWKSVV